MIAAINHVCRDMVSNYFRCVDYRSEYIPWLVDNVGLLIVESIKSRATPASAAYVPDLFLMNDYYLKLQAPEPELDWIFHDLTIGEGWQIFISEAINDIGPDTTRYMRVTVVIDDPLLAIHFKLACL